MAGEDFEHGIALRQILQFQRWPSLFSDLQAGFRQNALTYQGLSRFWFKKKSDSTTWNIEIEGNGLWQTNPLRQKGLGGSWNDRTSDSTRLEFWNLSKRHEPGEKSEISATIERLDFSWSMGRWDFDAGRQPISLGTSHFLGILDVLSPFHPGYLDASYKPGIDAFRVRTGMGTAGEAELIAVPTRPWQNRALIGRLRNNYGGFDVELIAGRFRDRNLAGIGYDGERKKVTWWGELALFERKPQKEFRHAGDERFAVAWISGLEKEIRHSLRMGLALMYQDFGVAHSGNLTQVYADAPYKEGWTFLGGRKYGLVTLKADVTPLIKTDLSTIFNLGDGSTLWQPKVTISTSNNSDLAVFGWVSTGREPSITPLLPGPGTSPLGSPSLTSTPTEFGLFPRGLGLIARRFF